MLDRLPRPRAGATIVLLVLLPLGCVGTNPDWDDARDHAESTHSPPADAASESGAGGDDAADSDPEPGTGSAAASSETGDACLEQGLARCEDDTMTVCVDLSVDPNHCGACFHGCDAITGSTCIEGQCRCEGGEWWAVCDGVCREVKDDPHACGLGCIDCTAADGDEATCKNGKCEGEGKSDD